MRTISAAVGDGPKAQNQYNDVVTIQEMLNQIIPGDGGASPPLKVDGKCGHKTKSAILQFQLRQFDWKLADGRVDPKGLTLIRMNECLDGLSAWAKNTVFRIRRQFPDSVPSYPPIVDVFEVHDQQHYRRTYYALVPNAEIDTTFLHVSTLYPFQGSWTQLHSTAALAIYDLQGPAKLAAAPQQPGVPNIQGVALTIVKPQATLSGKMPFPADSTKYSYFKCVLVQF